MMSDHSFMYQQQAASRRWRPAPILLVSILVHVVSAVIVVIKPSWWPWVTAAIVANHLIICLAVLTPRSNLLGSNLTRLPWSAAQRAEVCLTFDDGPDPQITPQVLDLLDRYNAKASFFCVGKHAAAFPQLMREIVRRGHSVENHSHNHPHAFAFYGWPRLRREIDSAQRALSQSAGQSPIFFRAPAGFRGPLLDPVLAARGLRYVSWTRRGFDGVSTDSKRILRRLTNGLAAGDILLLHDRNSPRGDPAVLKVLPALLDQIASHGLHAVSLPAAFRE